MPDETLVQLDAHLCNLWDFFDEFGNFKRDFETTAVEQQ